VIAPNGNGTLPARAKPNALERVAAVVVLWAATVAFGVVLIWTLRLIIWLGWLGLR
jgi:hypothetical protein